MIQNSTYICFLLLLNQRKSYHFITCKNVQDPELLLRVTTSLFWVILRHCSTVNHICPL